MLRQPKPRHALLRSKIVAIRTAVHVSSSTGPPPSPSPPALYRASEASPPNTQHQLFAGMPQRDSFFFPHHTFHLERTAAHCVLLKNGTLSHGPTRTSLVMAYAEVGNLGSSLLLFNEEAACRDVVSWIAIMTAFSKNRHFHVVIDLFQEMVRILEQMNSTALVIALSALSKNSELVKGRVLHCMIVKRGFDSDTSVCNALVDLYAKGGDLASSESLFRGVTLKDVVTWNSLIRGCWFNGFTEKVAFYFRQMSFSGLRFDQVTLSCVLSACSCLTELYGFGEMVHSWVVKSSYISHTSVANSLISFYSKCSNIEAAEKVFKDLHLKNIVSWNSMINGLVQNGRPPAETLDVLQEMQSTLKIQPDSVTVIAILQLCAEFSLFREGTAIHGLIIHRELGTFDLSVMNSLIDMYVKCSDLTSAGILFNTMPCRDIISWNTMISGYSHNGCRKEQAWYLFHELLKTGLRCTIGTLLGILPSFSCPKDLYLGKLVHCWILKYGLSNSVSAVNALILMYINCGDLLSSSFLFKGILFLSDVISWNTVIVGCVQNGYCLDALQVFMLMLRSLHTKPDPITLVSVLSACGQLDLLFFGMCLHGFTVKALMGSHVRVKNALITMYFRCKDMKSSEFIFQESEARNLCSWNCMISGYAQNNKNIRALELFRMMGTLQPDEITMVALLCACAQLGALRQGMQIHGHVIRLAVHHNTYVTASLVDMYSKCGQLDITMHVFENSVEKSVVTWNSMILAYGFHGYGREAIKLFAKMCEMGIEPTKSTFISILAACSHSGLVDDGWKHFNLMSEEFGIEPATEHCVCIVDMLGRAGKLDEAHDFIKQMSMKPEPGIWGALLSACKYHTNLEMGKSIAEYLFHNEPENVGYYVSLSNLYAALGKWIDAVNVRRMIECRGLTKSRGYSFIGVLSHLEQPSHSEMEFQQMGFASFLMLTNCFFISNGLSWKFWGMNTVLESGRLGESDPTDPDSGRVGSVESADSNGVWPTLADGVGLSLSPTPFVPTSRRRDQGKGEGRTAATSPMEGKEVAGGPTAATAADFSGGGDSDDGSSLLSFLYCSLCRERVGSERGRDGKREKGCRGLCGLRPNLVGVRGKVLAREKGEADAGSARG
ncbi:hypothetical protein Taro_050661 [Colocasia esculenta]|uniref:Pentatricopeptide repeat-containing protein n=1 Tax=Colocasia esculenta TaxID=4460 RepID=A0A843XEL9_COLES|nr:hypothetical protein [Colocasia esculenta]